MCRLFVVNVMAAVVTTGQQPVILSIMKRSMNDGGGDFGAKRRSTTGALTDMRILLPSQVLAFV